MTRLRRDILCHAGLVALVVITLVLGVRPLYTRASTIQPIDDAAGTEQVAAVVRAAWNGEAIPASAVHPRLLGRNIGLHLELRGKGVRLASVWEMSDETVADALAAAVRAARKESENASGGPASADTVLACTIHVWKDDFMPSEKRPAGNAPRGVLGIEFRARDESRHRYSPFDLISRNLNYNVAFREFEANHTGITDNGLMAGQVMRLFGCEQFLVPLDPTRKPALLYRGNQVVESDEVTPRRVSEALAANADWLIRSVAADGSVPARLAPSAGFPAETAGAESGWLTSVALAELARERKDAALSERTAGNLRFSLGRWYRERDGRAGAGEGGAAELGPTALAALAILRHPHRARFGAEEKALVATTFELQVEDGSFVSGSVPRGDGAASGQALLLWASLYRESKDPALLARYMQSFHRYQREYGTRRNPAFVSWHTQANYLLWQETHDAELAEAILVMNDWLATTQQWDWSLFPDMRGRFYGYERDQFGAPGAATDALTTRSLSDAYELAGALGRREQAATYRRVITRGLRHLLQLQYMDEIDLFFVPEASRDRLRGGYRSTVYDNEVLVEGALPLTGLLPILAQPSP